VSEVLLFHHVQGLTSGVVALADPLDSYDPVAAALLTERVTDFLRRVERH
jgi:hypothetical protein